MRNVVRSLLLSAALVAGSLKNDRPFADPRI